MTALQESAHGIHCHRDKVRDLRKHSTRSLGLWIHATRLKTAYVISSRVMVDLSYARFNSIIRKVKAMKPWV